MPESVVASRASTARVSAARERLLRVASELFYREGIHRVGLDRVLTEAQVTRATMYRYFPGKEALVAAYLTREDETVRAQVKATRQAATPPHADEPEPRAFLELLIEAIADDIVRHHDRGCPFINAAVEYPDAHSPIREIVTRHRVWFRSTLGDALEAAGTVPADSGAAAGALVLLRDAALVGAYLDGAEIVRPVFIAQARAAAGL
ncbi:TetR/AcrR family transcriptional regulator [Herbiconiux sp. P18]|uniref:TetR/AcrR family transcriptional regulator n=1 Tax=Herbiconiux liangxiaofengii TaxID=3342795 RepID=UPI0035BB7EE9